MAEMVYITGESGQGKTYGLRGLHPDDVFIIQGKKKKLKLPLASKFYKYYEKGKVEDGNMMVVPNMDLIPTVVKKLAIDKLGKRVIFIDDLFYLLDEGALNLVESNSTSWDDWTNLGYQFGNMLNKLLDIDDDVIIYVVLHTKTKESTGEKYFDYPGSVIEKYIKPEGLVNIILETVKHNNEHKFLTRGKFPYTYVRSPLGMFDNEYIPNDLKLVSDAIIEYDGGKPLQEFNEINDKISELVQKQK